MTTPSPSPGCAFTGCLDAPLVQWQRRPTTDELAVIVATEQSSRDQAIAAGASPDAFGALPTQQDTVVAVLACGIHAISMDLAAHVHGAVCTAPNLVTLPGCNCTPEPLPAPSPDSMTLAQPLPAHWQ